MTFTRTDQGLSNQHLFYKVDYVVFVEGGTHAYSMTDISQGQAGNQSADILFWQSLFSRYCPDLRFTFKPVGSKATLKNIAHRLKTGCVHHVVVAMDQDADRFKGDLIDSDCVFYTWGYSWENETFQIDVMEEVFFSLCPIDKSDNEENVRRLLQAEYESFTNGIRRYVYADILLRLKNRSLFSRKSYASLVVGSRNHASPPSVDYHKLRGLLRSRRRQHADEKPFSMGGGRKPSVPRDCFGHLYATYCYRLLMYVFKRFSCTPAISSANAGALGARLLSAVMGTTKLQAIHDHYCRQFLRLQARETA